MGTVKNDIATRNSRSFAFGPFRLVPARQLLLRGEKAIRIGGRALDLLTALVERPGELVTKGELFARAWPDTTVDEGNLKVNMAVVRRALEEGPDTPQFIATVVGRGYRFVAPVQLLEPVELPALASAPPTPTHNLPLSTTRIFGSKPGSYGAGILQVIEAGNWKNDDDLIAECLDGAERHGMTRLADLVYTTKARNIKPAWVTQ